MTNILYVTSSARGGASYSANVAARVIEELRRVYPESTLTLRDLARDPLPHIDADFITAIGVAQDTHGERERAMLARSDALIGELFAADILVIAAPMYNFGIPSTLKAWIDYVCRAGRTFKYTEKGPQGLVTGKRAILIHARGGVYSSGPAQAMDHQSTYLRSVLGFIGITDVQSIDVEGVALGADAAKQALESGIARARELAAVIAA